MAKRSKRAKKGGRVTPKGTRPAGFVPKAADADGCCSVCTQPASRRSD
ncbi:MAG: hypothetical protein AAF962_21650 [Actinomycetota bacterium]